MSIYKHPDFKMHR